MIFLWEQRKVRVAKNLKRCSPENRDPVALLKLPPQQAQIEDYKSDRRQGRQQAQAQVPEGHGDLRAQYGDRIPQRPKVATGGCSLDPCDNPPEICLI